MNINRLDVMEVQESSYNGKTIRTVALNSGKVLFLAHDTASNYLSITGYTRLYGAVDYRCKGDVILTFEEGVNPQRYKFVDADGLAHMVYRAKTSPMDAYDFVLWAKEKSVN